MDRPVDRPRSGARAAVLGGVLLGLLVLGVVLVRPVRQWLSAERVVDASRVRIASVTRGDLERDVSVQGRVVASLHPTLYSPAQGIVSVRARAGLEVKKGQLLAKVDSPELNSRLMQERSSLSSLQSDLARTQIAERQAELRSKQTIDLLSLKAEAASRAQRRAKDRAPQHSTPLRNERWSDLLTRVSRPDALGDTEYQPTSARRDRGASSRCTARRASSRAAKRIVASASSRAPSHISDNSPAITATYSATSRGDSAGA